MNVLERARDALKQIASGRAALAEIADAVKDGAVALATDDQAELNRMLEDEHVETRAAYDKLDAAIKAAGG